MDQVTRTKKYLKQEEWKALISECQASGVPVKAWCKSNNICEQTYYRNLQKLRAKLCESFPVPLDKPEKPVEFKKLEVRTPLANAQAAVIFISLMHHWKLIMVPRSKRLRQCFWR